MFILALLMESPLESRGGTPGLGGDVKAAEIKSWKRQGALLGKPAVNGDRF